LVPVSAKRAKATVSRQAKVKAKVKAKAANLNPRKTPRKIRPREKLAGDGGAAVPGRLLAGTEARPTGLFSYN
jgi:hypothetical protein